MGKSQETFNKKELEKKRQRKKQDKAQKKEDRKSNSKDGADFVLAYVDENGNISNTPPDPTKKIKIKEGDIETGVPRNRPVDQADLIRKGIVTFFNESKGYGFIKDIQTQESVFVHINGLTEKIKENNKVTFKIEMGPKGSNAVDVKVAR